MSLLSLYTAKASRALLSLAGRGGSLPGEIALKLDKQSLKKLKIDGPVVLVTGTNGKTSTANMIADAFEKAGYPVVTNRKGDNLKAGIASTLLCAASLRGDLSGKAIVLEVDELNIRRVLPDLPVSMLVVNNFFRDQLDRAREMEQLIQSIEGVLPDFEGTLVLNGNDPNTVRLALKAPKAKAVYFGVGKNKYSLEQTSEASEGKFCPVCASRLEYDYYQYSHIGHFVCPGCHFKTPVLDAELEDIQLDTNTFSWKGHTFHGPYQGMYSMYNYAALLAVAMVQNLPAEVIDQVFAQAPQPAGRNETFHAGDKEIILNLIKNPTGANEVMKVIEKDDRPKSIVIVLNDREQDGRDVSWIYDTLFEKLMQKSTASIYCTGSRANDMALRLYYGGWTGRLESVPGIEPALSAALQDAGTVYVIATYTALLPARSAIEKEVKK